MADPVEAARRGGLIAAGRPLLVMLSGGADSVCLLHVARELGAEVSALHVNYGLRSSAEQDEAFCRALCAELGIELAVERAWLPSDGNLQEQARDARYRLAERLARGDYAAAHTATDQAETVLYRLAVSPGRRALLGMAPRRGRLVRPLLEVTREEVRDWCRARGIDWREDPTNADPRFARARVRETLVPALRAISDTAERSVAETARLLRDESEVLEAATGDALAELGGGPAVALDALQALPRALARLVLRRLVEEASSGTHALPADRVDAVLALGGGGGTRSLDLGAGVRAVAEYGTLRIVQGGPVPEPDPVALPLPGEVEFGPWDVSADPDANGEVLIDAAAVTEDGLVVRGWRDGDRMRPLGLGGTKTLQDLFTDRKVPRELRRTLPVVACGDDVVWVAGLALDERYAAPAGAERVVGLSARQSNRRADSLRAL